jgi:hypothetical protein
MPDVLATTDWYVARAQSAPAPTLVVDGRSLGPDASRAAALAHLLAVRATIAPRDDLRYKHAVVFPIDPSTLRVEFFQGLANGTIDDSITVCGNSAAACVAVARHRWRIVGAGEIVVWMGGRAFAYRELT